MSLVLIPPTIETLVSPPAERAAGCEPARGLIDPLHPAFRVCRDITRARARNFYLGLQLAPEPKRSALLALYTWMRHADDLADDTGPSVTGEMRAEALAGLRRDTLESLASRGAPSPAREILRRGEEPWWPAFERTIRAYPLPASMFIETLDALDADARADTIPIEVGSTVELARYCDRVAGTVAMGCLAIWGVRREDYRDRACRLAILRGRAVQLTNILRDLREDLDPRLSRSYLPADSYREHGLTPQSLLSWSDGARCARFLRFWTDVARELYRESAELESLTEPACARVCWAMAAVYRTLLESIAENPERIARHRVGVAPARKLSIAITGWLGIGLPG